MSRYTYEEIRGFLVKGEPICKDCISLNERRELGAYDLILPDDEVRTHEDMPAAIICSRCHETL